MRLVVSKYLFYSREYLCHKVDCLFEIEDVIDGLEINQWRKLLVLDISWNIAVCLRSNEVLNLPLVWYFLIQRKCLLHILYIHATSPPDSFALCLLMNLYWSPVMLDSVSYRSWSVLIQVSVIKHILISFSIIVWRRASSLDLIDFIFISSILMRVWFHFVILHLGSGQSRCWWIPLFDYHVHVFFIPPLQPLNFLFNPNSLIFVVFCYSVYLCRIVVWDWWCVGRFICMLKEHLNMFY